MTPLTGIIMAMTAEARAVLGRGQWQVLNGRPVRRSAGGGRASLCVCSGLGPDRAEAAARWLIARGATELVLLGVAGGLHPHCRAGDLVVADTVAEVDERGGTHITAADARQARQAYASLAAAGLHVRLGRIVTVTHPVRSVADKASLYRRYRALAVDRESGAVLRAARAAGVPIRILRAVCDPAGRCLPEAVACGVAANGRRRPWYILLQLLADPSLLLPLWQVNKEMRAALQSLQRGWREQEGDRAGERPFSLGRAERAAP